MNRTAPLTRTLTLVRSLLPLVKDLRLPLLMLGVLILINHASAQTIDTALGGDVTSKWSSIIKSISGSIVIKLFCASIFVWGLVKYLPTRKDGVGQMIAGIVGFLVIAKLPAILGLFGMTI